MSETWSNARISSVHRQIQFKLAHHVVNSQVSANLPKSLKLVPTCQYTSSPSEGHAGEGASKFVRLNGCEHSIDLLDDLGDVIEPVPFEMSLDVVKDPKVCWGQIRGVRWMA